MTVSAIAPFIVYAGNGSTTVFPVPYKFLAAADLTVKQTPSGGAQTTLTLGTDYTVSGVGNDSGGSITLSSALASGTQLSVRRNTPRVQPTAFANLRNFSEKTHELAFDRTVMVAQEVAQDLSDQVAELGTLIGAGGNGGAPNDQYLELASNPSASASTSGKIRVRSNAGVIETSPNGRGYQPHWADDILSHTASAGASSWTPTIHQNSHLELLLDSDLQLFAPTVDEGAAYTGPVRFTVKVTQDSTGYHLLALNGYVGATNFMARQGPGQTSTLEFKRTASGTWYLHKFDGIDVRRAIDITDFGADPTSVAVSTTAFKKAFARFSGNLTTGGAQLRSGAVFMPPGNYVVDDEIGFVGDYSHSFELKGGGPGNAPSDTLITFTGPNTGNSRVLHFMAASDLKLKNFCVNSNGRAKYGIHIDVFAKTYPTNFAGSTQQYFTNVGSGSCRSEDGAANWLVGYIASENTVSPTGTTLQIDTMHWDGCFGGAPITGDTVDTAHIRFLQGGNVKNWTASRCQFIAGRFGIKTEVAGSGYALVQGCGFGSLKGDDSDFNKAGAAVYGGFQHISIRNCGLEGAKTRFAYDNGSGSGNNRFNWEISGCYHSAPAPADGFVLALSGGVVVRDSDFVNSTSSTSWAKVAVRPMDGDGVQNAARFERVGFGGPATGSTSDSLLLGTTLPIFDFGLANNMAMDEYSIGAGPNVTAVDCYIIDPVTGNSQNRVQDLKSRPAEVIRAKLLNSQPVFWSTGQTVKTNGLENGYCRTEKWTMAAFNGVASASHTERSAILAPPLNSRGLQLTKVDIEVTTPITTSGGGTVSAKLGTTSGGAELLNLTAISGTLPKTVGDAPADVGSAFTGAGFGRPVYRSSTTTYLTLSISAGNLNTITGGAFEIRYFYEARW